MENDYFKKGEIIQVVGGYSKKGREGKLEVHLGRQGNIILAPKDVVLPDVIAPDIARSGFAEASDKHERENADKKSAWTIQSLHNKEGFVRFISDTVKVEFFKELTLKSGEKSFLLKLILSDESSSIKVNIWGLKMVECVKLITDGDTIKISNVVIKENSYTNEKELSFTKNSDLEVL